METKWTQEQKEAIFTRNCNLLVAAGAGAGKTAVLVERIIQKITDDKDDVDIDKLLVVTFTNAAAAEMRERIGDAISKKLEIMPESKNLQKQLMLLNKANIMTIHSFCLQVIKSNFHVIDLDPNFRVCDETESILLKQEAIDEIFEDKYEENNEDFIELIKCYGGKNDFKVENMILDLYEFAESNPWPEKWISTMVERFNVDENFSFEKSPWFSVISDYIIIEVKGCKSKINKALEIVENAEGIDYYLEPIKKDLENINSIMECSDLEDLKEQFNNLQFEKLPVKRNKDADKEAKEKAKKIRDDVKKKLTEISEDVFLRIDNMGRDLKEMHPKMKCLGNMVMEFNEKYEAKKRDRGLVDFNDIEHFCLQILIDTEENGEVVPSKIALDYKQKFEEILIDEYQDSNEVQEVIMNAISRKNDIPNMFMVGDVKQSIYRFRQAKPELFLDKYNRYSGDKVGNERKIKLFKNFRSRSEVIFAVNYVFNQIMSKNIGELEYDEGEMLESGANFPESEDNDMNDESNIELHLIDKKDNDIDEESALNSESDLTRSTDEETPDNIQIEGRLVGRRILDLINNENFKVYDKNEKGYRHVTYKDIVILLRTTSNWAPTFVEELQNLGIPVFADTNTGYFDNVEIRTIISLLQIIDNPIQDIPLLSILRSPIEGFSAEEIIDIRMVDRDINFYNVLRIIVESDDTDDRVKHISKELKEKINNFLSKLNKWRKKSLYMPIDEFIWYVYIDTGYYGFAGAMTGGKQRQANLRILFQRAKQYESTSYKGLFNFINFINKLRNSSGDMGSAKILGENEDVVRIMSVHKSKGLEFPIVILSGTGKNFNFMDMNRSVLFHGELGLGPEYVNTERRISYPTIAKQVLKKKIKVETLSEEMRILYVALTRAKEKLIITGSAKDLEKSSEKWCEALKYEDNKIPEYIVINAKNYLDWLVPVIARNCSGKVIREICGANEFEHLIEDKSKWYVKLWKKEEFKSTLHDENEKEDIVEIVKNESLKSDTSEYYEEINRRLNWQYRYKEACSIPSKFSVSELKRRFDFLAADEGSSSLVSSNKLSKPVFLQETRKLSAAERGTLIHTVMQHIDLEKVSCLEEIISQINDLVNREFIRKEEVKSIDVNKILKFFKSTLGERMIKSKKVFREVPFIINLDSTELYKDLSEDIYEDEKVLLQGIIDCYFEEDDELVLLDYKTDYVEDLNKVKEKYLVQIEYYKNALERLTGKSVRNKYLYLFFNDNIVEL
ncbi:helicase-exonuclease AddAB subunit AddA [Clostridium sp. P21]|uniref:ATP-dependent helicase/nuclease subunit A n=1 Tax=Clostridium muellerianum TaxID=2716538 RepID=A0A7Y0EEK4_9CLOT|nr:helicase-exonuclease AddAB subunit AddA [Clostridium muellerianum]NMM61987.1 helicase-exonuclease AddAB subunit AddA [Clostridium muellerianum]